MKRKDSPIWAVLSSGYLAIYIFSVSWSGTSLKAYIAVPLADVSSFLTFHVQKLTILQVMKWLFRAESIGKRDERLQCIGKRTCL